MTDRYVIVYRDGSTSPVYDATECDYRLSLMKSAAWPIRPPRPAYRIRIREKARKPIKGDAPGIFFGDPFNNLPAQHLCLR
jgi:hypothetical protein